MSAKSSKPNTMSLRRHRKFGGHSGKSPKLRHAIKREAEAAEIKDRTRIIDPKTSIKDLFK